MSCAHYHAVLEHARRVRIARDKATAAHSFATFQYRGDNVAARVAVVCRLRVESDALQAALDVARHYVRDLERGHT